MNILVDTHAIIWFVTDDDQLTSKAKELIENQANSCLGSIASLWEIGIKNSRGKLDLKVNLERIFEIIEESGFSIITKDREFQKYDVEYAW